MCLYKGNETMNERLSYPVYNYRLTLSNRAHQKPRVSSCGDLPSFISGSPLKSQPVTGSETIPSERQIAVMRFRPD